MWPAHTPSPPGWVPPPPQAQAHGARPPMMLWPPMWMMMAMPLPPPPPPTRLVPTSFVNEFVKEEVKEPHELTGNSDWTVSAVRTRMWAMHVGLERIQQLLQEVEAAADEDKKRELLRQAQDIKAHIAGLLPTITHLPTLQLFKLKLAKRKRRKIWKRNHRQHLAAQRRIRHQLQLERDQEIEEWRKQYAEQVEHRRQATELIRQQQRAKTQKMKQKAEQRKVKATLSALEELRKLRIAKLRKQGIILPTDDAAFMQQEPEEEQTDAPMPKIKRRRKDAPVKPVVPSPPPTETLAQLEVWYLQAHASMAQLIAVRHDWDKHIAPRGQGSNIPLYFIPPPLPSNNVWSSYIVSAAEKAQRG